MKKSELKRQIDELQLQVERLNERISNLEAEPKVYPPTVYPTPSPHIHPRYPLYPGDYGWEITCMKR